MECKLFKIDDQPGPTLKKERQIRGLAWQSSD